MTGKGVKILKRKAKQSSLESTRITRNAIRKRKKDVLRRINYTSLITTILLPLWSLIYLFRANQFIIAAQWKTRLFAFIYYNVTMLAFTSGYHKCYAHSSFRPKVSAVHLFFCFFGSAMGLGPIREWAAMHRSHHQFTDDPEKDPYSIKRGFLWTHWGWILMRPKTKAFYQEFIEHEFPSVPEEHEIIEDSTFSLTDTIDVPDLILDDFDLHVATEARDKSFRKRTLLQWVLWQESRYWVFFLLSSLILPILVTVFVCEDSWINGLLYPGILRMFTGQQQIFFSESICHSRFLHVTFPCQPFNDNNSLVNCRNPLVDILTFGQALHNYHHEFPNDYRGDSLLFSIDPTKWFIWILSVFRLVDGLSMTPTNLVMQLRIQQQQHVLNLMKSQLNWGTPISKLPMITVKEFQSLCDSDSDQDRIFIVIQNIIHDITPFKDQHPGGLALLQASRGKDATKAFYGGVYGHLTAASNLLATMRIGVLDVGDEEGVWGRVAREEGVVEEKSRQGQFQSAEAA